jgi:RNA polymerase sigma-70 factor (ECF subfamily)
MTERPTVDDAALLRRVTEGDEPAFTELYGRWQRRIHRFALRMTGSREAAEDVTHDVFLALMRDGGRFDPRRGSASSWIYGVARNHVRRRLQRDRSWTSLPEEAAGEPAILDSLARQEEVETVRRALLSLPPADREVVVLCEMEEMTYAEAAEALGCALGTVRSRLHRARGRLLKALEGAGLRAPLRAAEGVG